MTLIAKQFGFTNGAGVIANLVDGSESSFYQPIATDFGAYTAQWYLSDKVSLNTGASFPALEIDFGVPTRVPQFMLKTATLLSLGPSLLIGSNNGATSVADTLQSGDIVLGNYRAQELCSGRFISVPAMKDADIRRRFLRFLQRTTNPAFPALTPGPVNSVTYDIGSGQWQVVPYTTELVIEAWGGGASGGTNAYSQDGGQTLVSRGMGLLMTANGGSRSASGLIGGLGGTASGGNTLNITGANGENPNPDYSQGQGYSGAGGDSPNGGMGGARIYQVFEIGRNYYYGLDGQQPGGGGGGHSMWYPAGDVAFSKYPGGGAGGYSKHVIARGSGAAEPGDFIGWQVGNGGYSSFSGFNLFGVKLPQGDGRGAQGRVRFSWT